MVDLLFYAFAAVALGSAIGVILAKNPVGSLLFMVATLGAVAGIFVLMEAHFLAAIQVMVYAGAIMVLFLFVIMLLNLGHEFRADSVRVGWMVGSFALTGLMAAVLIGAFRGTEASAAYVGTAGGEQIDALVAEQGAVGAIAEPLFTTYVVQFELTGILLLVAVVGAIALAKRAGE